MSHPSYPNPAIAEALCEIHFRLGPDEPWKASITGEFYKAIQDEFPGMEPAQEIGVQFEFGGSEITHKVLPPRSRMRFSHKARPLLLQLTENILTVNLLPTYPGWDQMRADVLGAWSHALVVMKPERVTRIGLRYINRIPRSSAVEDIGAWLKPTNYIPPGVLQARKGVLARIEAALSDEHRIVVTLAQQPAADGAPFGSVILDIDRLVEKDIPPVVADVEKVIDRLHEEVWAEFSAACGDKLITRLQGRA